MKKIGISLLLVALLVNLKAQQTVGTPEQIANFLKTTTYVVLENNPMLTYNTIIKETVEKHWTITKFEFVTYTNKDEFEIARKDPNKSFLVVTKEFYDKDEVKVKYKYLSVQLGGDYDKVNQMPELASVPVAYDDLEEDTYSYKLGTLCLFLQNHILLTQANPKLTTGKKAVAYYNKNMAAGVKEKTLYLTKEDLTASINTEASIKTLYGSPVKIVTREELEAAIEKRDENVAYLHKVGPEGAKRKARCYKAILGASDAKLYYFGWHMINESNPEGLLAKDLKKLAKAKKVK